MKFLPMASASAEGALSGEAESGGSSVFSSSLRSAALFGCDFLAAGTAALFVAPLVAVVDRAVVEAAQPERESPSSRLRPGRASLRSRRGGFLVSASRTSLAINPQGRRPSATAVSASVRAGHGRAAFASIFFRGLAAAVSRPAAFARSAAFSRVFGVYAGTFAAANAADSFASGGDSREGGGGMLRFTSATLVNAFLCLRKDVALARIYGRPNAREASFPVSALAMLLARDALTVAAAFNAPPLLAQVLRREDAFSDEGSRMAAQLLAPLLVQALSTPLHLLALSLFNDAAARGSAAEAKRKKAKQQLTQQQHQINPTCAESSLATAKATRAVSTQQQQQPSALSKHLGAVKRLYAQTLAARMLRVLPAFGFGGVVNSHVRRILREALLGGERAPAPPL